MVRAPNAVLRYLPGLLVLSFTLVGGAGLLLSTRWGIGASPDSVVYIGVAQSLIEGSDLAVPFGTAGNSPLTRFPPAYPILLAALGSTGIDVQDAARWLNVGLFGATMALVALMLRRMQGSRVWVPIAGAFLVLISPPLLTVYAMAWTEPMFLWLGFSGLLLLAVHLGEGGNASLFVSAVLIAVAVLTRYAGIAFVATGSLGILTLSREGLRGRALKSLLFAAVASLPTSLWGIANLMAVGTVTGRQLVFHPIQIGHATQALSTLASWLLIPASASGYLKLAVLLGLCALGGVAIRRSMKMRGAAPKGGAYGETHARRVLASLLVSFAAIYGFFLLISLSLFDGNIPFDDRILSPVYLVGSVFFVFLGGEALRPRSRMRVTQFALAGLVVLFSLGLMSRAVGRILDGYWRGIGFNSLAWRDSPTLASLEQIPSETPLFSNSPEAIYLHSGRVALRLPRVFQPSDQTPNPEYSGEVEAMARRLAEEAGVIVYFGAIRGRSLPSEADLEEALPLTSLVSTSDGTIYVLLSPPRCLHGFG
jgi:hypothetical protein